MRSRFIPRHSFPEWKIVPDCGNIKVRNRMSERGSRGDGVQPAQNLIAQHRLIILKPMARALLICISAWGVRTMPKLCIANLLRPTKGALGKPVRLRHWQRMDDISLSDISHSPR